MIPDYNFSGLLHPLEKDIFFTEYFESAPVLVQRNDSCYFEGFPPLEELLQRVARAGGLTNYDISLKDASRDLPDNDYMHLQPVRNVWFKSGLDLGRTLQLFNEGRAHMVVKNLAGEWPILDKCRGSIMDVLNCNCDIRLYLTPLDGPGLSSRYEVHDLFVLQLSGNTRWKIYDSAISNPLTIQANAPFDTRSLALKLDCVARTGDTVYIPRGAVYEQIPTNALSHYAVFQLNHVTYLRLILDIVKSTGQEKEFRKGIFSEGIAPGRIVQDNIERVTDILQEHLTVENLESLFSNKKIQAPAPLPSAAELLSAIQKGMAGI